MGKLASGYGSNKHPDGCPCRLHSAMKGNQFGYVGDEVGNEGKHIRQEQREGKASEYDCELCGDQADEWSQIHGTTGLESEHFRALCRSCHRSYDFDRSRARSANGRFA